VYQDAITKFDTAIALIKDSTRILNMARIGKARALLALGNYDSAAAAVATIPDGFSYDVKYAGTAVTGIVAPSSQALNFAYVNGAWLGTVADTEGGNGLPYRSSDDPRTATTSLGTNAFGVTMYYPAKYAKTGDTPVVLADWIEARLIEAEAALKAGHTIVWLSKLNHLRETAITPALADTTDPGTLDAEVNLMFRERAFWLFLQGHRLGDMRRLVRQYGRSPQEVFPTGSYAGGTGSYGVDVNAPIPATELEYNSKFAGCIDRNA
jgi:hypothetical protein